MSTDSNKASSMAELMARHKSPFISLHKGEEIEGKITKLTASEVLLDINAKTEAVVLEKERKYIRAILSLLKVGDTVKVTVLNPESDTGNSVVSLRKFLDSKIWEKLAQVEKNHQKISVTVKGMTKGGYLVETKEGLDGFLPNSHISVRSDNQDIVGQSFEIMIAELHPESRKLIVSQKTILGAKDFDDLVKNLKVGQKVKVVVTHIATFGIFVNLPTVNQEKKETYLDGFIHISEISWEKVTDISNTFNVGDSVETVIMGFDNNAKRVDLSIKRLTSDPFDEVLKQFKVDQKVNGNVEKISETGITVDLGKEGIEGFIRKEKIPPTTKYEIGQKVTLTVSQVDLKKHRIYLTPVLLEKPLTYR